MTQNANLINLTPHIINVVVPSGNIDIPASGQVARCSQTSSEVSVINGIPVTKQEFGEVVGLPAEQEGTYFIVSRLVAAACPDRHDLLIPGPLVRNADGQPIGCKGLSVL